MIDPIPDTTWPLPTTARSPDMAELLEWTPPARRMPDADQRVLLWLRDGDGLEDWTPGHWDGESWRVEDHALADCDVLAWADVEGPGR